MGKGREKGEKGSHFFVQVYTPGPSECYCTCTVVIPSISSTQHDFKTHDLHAQLKVYLQLKTAQKCFTTNYDSVVHLTIYKHYNITMNLKLSRNNCQLLTK